VTVDAPSQEHSTGRHRAIRRVRALRPARADLSALGGFVLLTVLLFRQAWRSPTTTWIGGAGDPPLFMWFLRWMPYALGDGQNPLFSNHINYPDGVNLMWNTAIPLPALLLSPLTLTLGPVLTYNILVTSAVALTGWCAYLMLRRYVASRAAAFAGGLLYGFSPYVYAHAHEHANLTAAFVPPLMFLLLDDILVRQRRRAVVNGLLLGGLAFVQLMISEELLATQVLVAAVGLAILMVLHPNRVRAHARHAVTALGMGLGTALTLAAFPLLFQFYGPRSVRTGSLWGPDIFVTDLLGLVIPTEHAQLSPAWTSEITRHFTDACCGSEWSAYVGIPLLGILIIVTTRLWATPLVRLAGLLATATTVLSMGPHLHVRGFVSPMSLPFAKLAELPVIRNMLAVRLMLYVYLMAALLVGVALDRLLRGSRRRPALAASLAVVALMPLVPNLTFPATRAGTPSFFRSDNVRRVEKDSVLLVAPFARDTSTSGPMLWQAEADMRYRMPAGYALGPDRSGRFTYLPIPTPLSKTMEEIQRGTPPPPVDPATRSLLASDLDRADVRAVAVGPMQNREAMIGFFRELLRRDPEAVGGVALWTEVEPDQLR